MIFGIQLISPFFHLKPLASTFKKDYSLSLSLPMIPTYQKSDQLLQPYTSFTYSIQDQGEFCDTELHQLEYQQEDDNFASFDGGSKDLSSLDTRERDGGLKFSLRKREDVGNGSHAGSAKWMCSKMRVMGKTIMNSDQMISSEASTNAQPIKFEDHNKQTPPPLENDDGSNSSSNNGNNPVIRVCSDCNTTKTPLWRGGPRGPKSLCNACGIRQRKARRAMAAAVAAANDTNLPTKTLPLKISKGQHKGKRSKNGHVAQYKKRSKLATPISHGREKLCFEDFLINLSKSLAFHQVFPQDEKEAAILLMALSCGLVHG